MGSKKKAPKKPNDNLSERTWLTVAQVAEYLALSKVTIYRLLERGDIPTRRIGKLHRFYRPEIDKWMLKQYAE